MDPTVAATAFGLVALGELPDKTMFASLLMSSRGRPLAVWSGAAAAFAVHVAIAVAAGAAAVALVPRRELDVGAGVMLVAFGGWAWRARRAAHAGDDEATVRPGHLVALRAAGVIFLAEWGDLTQLLTADLAARSHHPFAVALGALAALWAVAGVAVVSGSRLLGCLSIRTLRTVTAAVLTTLGVVAIVGAVTRS
ncbi:MAG: TMEM165/GDT1 family protein [Acidimicrobiales bacterium]